MATKAQKELEDRAQQKALTADLEMQIEAGTKAQGEKLAASVEHLIKQLETTAKRYRTVNGYMQVRSTINEVLFGADTPKDVEATVRSLAVMMSGFAEVLAERIRTTTITDLTGDMLDEYVDLDFVGKHQELGDIVRQLLVFNLLQNIGPALDEIISFRDSTQHELDNLHEALAKLTSPEAKKLEVVKGGKN